MNNFVIAIKFYVNLKKNFKIGLNQISFILNEFNWSTTETAIFAEACLHAITGTIISHYFRMVGPSLSFDLH